MSVRISAAMVAREQKHRRRLLGAVGTLLFLSVSPVFGHHVAQGAETLLGNADHIGPLCLVALHVLLAPVHGLVHLLVIAGLLYAAWDRFRAWRQMRCVLGDLDATHPAEGDAFAIAARAASLPRHSIRVVAGLPNPAFTAGFVKPSVYVAAELAERLTAPQLAAVLAHEGAHVARRDPLRLSLLRFLACTLFWLPALRRLADDVADEAEVQADDRAAGDRPLVLASALLAVAALGTPRPIAGVVGLARHDILERRVRRLAGEAPIARTHVTRRSIAGAAGALLLVWISGAIMAHPLGAAGHGELATDAASRDCTSHDGPAILHVFCDGTPFGSAAGDCPHHPLRWRSALESEGPGASFHA